MDPRRSVATAGLRAGRMRLALILMVIGSACRPTADVETSTLDLDSVSSYLDRAATDEAFSGVVLIGSGTDIVFERAYGWADADLGMPLSPEHRFRIGSLTKPITASAVLVAADRGLLALDGAICPLLPLCPASWERVTVRHLLSHTSGIPDRFGDLRAVPVETTREELSRVLATVPSDEPLRAAPGSEYAYSNFNYVLLGVVLEEVAGAPWPEVMRLWVFEPLGLSTMAYDDVYSVMEGRVRGYSRDDDLSLRNIDYDDHSAYAAGGLLSSAGELFRWSRAVLEGRLFDEALVSESLTPVQDDYGYGWQVRRFFDRRVYNHTGGIDGFSSHLAHYPDEGLTVVVLSNVEDESAILRACDVVARLFVWNPGDGREAELTPRERCGLEP